MSNLLDFIKKELNEKINKRKNFEELIHKDQLDISLIESKINNIYLSNDNTELPFYTNHEIPGFDGDEIKRLRECKQKLSDDICEFEKSIHSLNIEISELQNLLNNHDAFVLDNKYNIIDMQEKERQRIAGDIHDTVVQNMTALIYKNDFITKIIESDQQRAKTELALSNNIIRDCINELRSIIFDLRPMSINDLNFENALSNVIHHINESTDIIINYNCSTKGKFPNSIITISIIRILQELTNNSIKHSGCSQIDINVNIYENYIEINYLDNGVGFNPDHISKNNIHNHGFGLSIINDRVSLLGGIIKKINDNKKGVHYMVKIPNNKEKNKCQ